MADDVPTDDVPSIASPPDAFICEDYTTNDITKFLNMPIYTSRSGYVKKRKIRIGRTKEEQIKHHEAMERRRRTVQTTLFEQLGSLLKLPKNTSRSDVLDQAVNFIKQHEYLGDLSKMTQ